MDVTRETVYAIAGIIVLVAIATGPIGIVTVPDEERTSTPPGTGNATVTVVSTPEGTLLESGRQGGDVYYLHFPDLRVEVSDLRGNPILTYSAEIEDIGYTRSSVYFLGSGGEGPRWISLEEDALEEPQLDNGTYQATLELTLRVDGEERTVYRETAVVERGE